MLEPQVLLDSYGFSEPWIAMVFIFLQKEGKRNANVLENNPELFYENTKGVLDKRNSG